MSQTVATLFTEDPTASDPVRTEHIGELESVIALAREEGRREGTYWRPDHASVLAFARSQGRLRRRVMQSLGLPLPRSIAAHPSGDARHQQLGEDEIATYSRAWFPVLPGLHAVGLLIVPHEVQEPAPLVVALHGGSGSPEIATFVQANYFDMVRGAVARGCITWVPTLSFLAPGYGDDIRVRLDSRARRAGTTLTALELVMLRRSLDWVLRRPDIDASRVAAIGCSYGGFYASLLAALDHRVGVTVASCSFMSRETIVGAHEPYGWLDWVFAGGETWMRDPELMALICPRPLMLQNGQADELFPVQAARDCVGAVGRHYDRLGMGDRFSFVDFEGGHEWNDASAWPFIERHLLDNV